MINREELSRIAAELGYPVPSQECLSLADKVHDVLCDFASCSVGSDEGSISIQFPLKGKYSSVDIIDEGGVSVWFFFNRGNVTELNEITNSWESTLRGLFEK